MLKLKQAWEQQNLCHALSQVRKAQFLSYITINGMMRLVEEVSQLSLALVDIDAPGAKLLLGLGFYLYHTEGRRVIRYPAGGIRALWTLSFKELDGSKIHGFNVQTK